MTWSTSTATAARPGWYGVVPEREPNRDEWKIYTLWQEVPPYTQAAIWATFYVFCLTVLMGS